MISDGAGAGWARDGECRSISSRKPTGCKADSSMTPALKASSPPKNFACQVKVAVEHADAQTQVHFCLREGEQDRLPRHQNRAAKRAAQIHSETQRQRFDDVALHIGDNRPARGVMLTHKNFHREASSNASARH